MKAGWRTKPLGELLEVQNGYAFSSKLFSFTSGIPLIRIRDLKSDGETEVRYEGDFEPRYIVTSGDLLIGMDGEFRCHIWRGADALLNQRVCRLTNFSSALLPRFLYYGINKYLQEIEDVTAFTTVKHLSSKTIGSIQFPLPPLEEQRRIIAILDEAFEGLSRARANAEANLQSARELYETTIESSIQSAGGIPITLTELLERNWITGHLDGNHGSDYPRKEEFVSEGVPYISANCIEGDAIDMSRCKYLAPDRADTLRKGIAKDRDVLFAHNATVGPVALLRTKEPRVILSTSLTYYRCDATKICPEFLVAEMRSAGFKRQYEAVMGQATRNQVPITMQRTFTHLIPAFEEQQRIARVSTQVGSYANELERRYKAKIQDVDQVRQSLLQKAFAGELTVREFA